MAIADNGDSLLLNLARAFRWQGMIDRGEFRNATELAKAVSRNQAYVSRVLRLTLLSPKIVHAIITNTLPTNVTVRTFRFGVPARWEEQHKLIGLE
ncbi:hypothetical protein SDC9_199081 [bioreactor metagenome]|uniref:Uncharacterized protein n=1 Tax=bioreactor metagenome TaxID=1076179 RepID=A0A645IK99_9ZZZZ